MSARSVRRFMVHPPQSRVVSAPVAGAGSETSPAWTVTSLLRRIRAKIVSSRRAMSCLRRFQPKTRATDIVRSSAVRVPASRSRALRATPAGLRSRPLLAKPLPPLRRSLARPSAFGDSTVCGLPQGCEITSRARRTRSASVGRSGEVCCSVRRALSARGDSCGVGNG